MTIQVKTQYGTIEGLEQPGLNIFKAIPFVKPAVADLRFAVPQAPQPWSGVLDASNFSAAFPQDGAALMGLDKLSDDSLYLNVWTPGCDQKKRPVMVWIHGGGFIIGAASQELYHGHNLAKQGDVVVVSINYRLGVLGYANLASVLNDDRFSVNNGLQDQVAALKWVQENIADFGGDPDNVTIFGESAGGMSVGTLLGTPSAKDLFHKAIVQSGSADHVTSVASSKAIAEAFLQAMEVSDEKDVYKLFECSIDDLLKAQRACTALSVDRGIRNNEMPMYGMTLVPVVDGTILPKRPIDAVRDGDAKDKALMVGFNSDEWNLFLQTPLFGNLGDSASKKALDDAGLLAMFKKSLPNQAENAVQLYYQGKEDSETARLQAYSEMETDRMFRLPTYQLLEAQRQHQANTYGYQVTWQAPGLGGKLGACHAVEVPFVFGLLGGMIGQLFVGDEEKAKPLSDKIISAWSGFAKNSTPQSAFADWPVFEEKHGALMALGEKCGPISALDENTKKFWYPLMY